MKRLLFILMFGGAASTLLAGIWSMEGGDLRRSKSSQAPTAARAPMHPAWYGVPNIELGQMLSGPVILDDRVIQPYAGGLACFSRTNGQLLWTWLNTGGDYLHNTPTYDAARGVVYVIDGTARITALNISDGTKAWDYWEPWAVGAKDFAGALLVGGLLYVPYQGIGISCLDPDTRTVIWRRPYPEAAASNTPAYEAGRIYLTTSVGRVMCLNSSDGSIVWSVNHGFPQNAPTVLTDTLVIVQQARGVTYAMDRATGAFAWQFAGASVGNASPAICGDLVIVGNDDRYVYAINPSNGTLVWKHGTEGNFAGNPPLVVCGIIFITGCAGKMYAIDGHTGQRVWTYEHHYMNSHSALSEVDGLVVGGDDSGRVWGFLSNQPGNPAACFCDLQAKTPTPVLATSTPTVSPTPAIAACPDCGTLDGVYSFDGSDFSATGPALGAPTWPCLAPRFNSGLAAPDYLNAGGGKVVYGFNNHTFGGTIYSEGALAFPVSSLESAPVYLSFDFQVSSYCGPDEMTLIHYEHAGKMLHISAFSPPWPLYGSLRVLYSTATEIAELIIPAGYVTGLLDGNSNRTAADTSRSYLGVSFNGCGIRVIPGPSGISPSAAAGFSLPGFAPNPTLVKLEGLQFGNRLGGGQPLVGYLDNLRIWRCGSHTPSPSATATATCTPSATLSPTASLTAPPGSPTSTLTQTLSPTPPPITPTMTRTPTTSPFLPTVTWSTTATATASATPTLSPVPGATTPAPTPGGWDLRDKGRIKVPGNLIKGHPNGCKVLVRPSVDGPATVRVYKDGVFKAEIFSGELSSGHTTVLGWDLKVGGGDASSGIYTLVLQDAAGRRYYTKVVLAR